MRGSRTAAWVSVAYYAIRTSRIDPIESLRCEWIKLSLQGLAPILGGTLFSMGSADVAVATIISKVTDSHHCTVLAVSPLEHQLE